MRVAFIAPLESWHMYMSGLWRSTRIFTLTCVCVYFLDCEGQLDLVSCYLLLVYISIRFSFLWPLLCLILAFHIAFIFFAQSTYDTYWVPIILILILHSTFIFMMQIRPLIINIDIEPTVAWFQRQSKNMAV